MYTRVIKRIIDLGISTILIVLTIPLFTIISLVLYFNQKQVFFFQTRPGKDGKPFTVYKFKTMKDASKGAPSEDLRITPVGRILRKTNLDELPQLFNVLLGSMSLVGPRPFLMEYLNFYNEEQKKRHRVKPGLTGLAQINGGNNISWGQKLKYDVEYVEKVSLVLDIEILIITFYRILIFRGFDTGSFIPEKFTGIVERPTK